MSQSRPAWEPWRRNLYTLWSIEFAAFTGLSLILPFVPLYVRQLGVSDPADVTRWSGLLLSGPFLVSFLATPIWGALGDRYGQKLMVVRALLGSAACYVGMALATSVESLLVWRLALGGVSGFLAAGMALVSVTVPDGERGYALGLLQSVVPAAGLIGPLLGGVLADLIGYRAIFDVVGVMCFAGGITAWWVLIEPRQTVHDHHSPEARGVLVNLGFAWRHKPLRRALWAITLGQALVTCLQPIFVLFVEQLGVEPRLLSTVTGGLFAATGVTALFTAPWWGRRADQRGFLRVALITVGGSAVALALHAVVTSPLQLLFLRLVYGCFVSGLLPPLLGFVSNHSPAQHRGGLMGLSSSAAMLGNLLGPLAGGFVGAHLGLRAVFWGAAAGMLVLGWQVRRIPAAA